MALLVLTDQGNEGFAFDIQSVLTIKFPPNFKLRGNGINHNISQVNSGSPEYIPDKDFGDKTSTNVTTVQQETSNCEVSDCKANKTMSSVISGHGKLSNETHSLNMEGKIEAQVPKETTQCEDFAFKEDSEYDSDVDSNKESDLDESNDELTVKVMAVKMKKTILDLVFQTNLIGEAMTSVVTRTSITMFKFANGHGKSSVETHNPSPSTEGMIEVKFPQQASHCEDPVFSVKAHAAPSDTKITEDEKCTIKDSTLRQLPKEKCILPCIEDINELKTELIISLFIKVCMLNHILGFLPRRHYPIDEKQKYYSKTKSQFMLKKQHHFTFSLVLCSLITSGTRLAAAESGCSTPDPCEVRRGNSVKILCIFEENINPSNGEISLWHITSGYERKVMAYFGKDNKFASPDYKIFDNGTKEVGVYISAFSKEHEGKYECRRAGLENVPPCPSNLIFLDYSSTNGPNVSSNISDMVLTEMQVLDPVAVALLVAVAVVILLVLVFLFIRYVPEYVLKKFYRRLPNH